MNNTVIPGSFKQQIILTYVFGFFALAVAFSIFQVKTERNYLYRDSIDETISLAESLAASSRSWVLANDVVGLQEVVHSFLSHPELHYAMVISTSGQVLAHTDSAKVGNYVSDAASLTLLKSAPANRIIIDEESLIDIAVPIMVDHRHVAWARVGQGRESIVGYLHNMILNAAIFVLIAIILSLLAAFFIARRLGNRIGFLVQVAEAVQAGNFATRANISGGDEISQLATSINHMLDVLAKEEEQLRENEALLQATIKILPVGLWYMDAKGKIVFSNDAARQIWAGVRYVGLNRLDEYQGWKLATGKRMEALDWAGARAVERGKTSLEEEVEIECFDGTHKIILDSAVPLLGPDGSIKGAVIINQDITERKKAELEREQYFEFFSSSTDLMCIADPNGCFKKINPACMQTLGYAENELLSKPFIEFVHPDDKQSTLDEMSKQIQRGFSLKFENRYLCKDGSFRWLSWNANYMQDENITYATARDISERKRAEQELLEQEMFSQSLLRLSRNMERSQTYSEVLNAAQDEVKTIIGYQSLWVYLLSEDKQFLKAFVAGGPVSDTVMSEEGTATLTIKGDRMLEEIAASKEIVLVEDARTDERVNKAIAESLGMRTVVNIPIMLFDRHMGCMGTGTFAPEGVKAPSKPQQKYLIAMASHLAVALDRIHLLAERKKAELALSELNKDFVTLLENTGDFIYFKDKDSRMRFCSQTLAAITGHTNWRDMIGKHDLEIFPQDTARIYYEE